MDVRSEVEGEGRRGVVRGLEAWMEGGKRWGARRRGAVEGVERVVEGRRVDGMRKAYLLEGVRGEELVWRMHCWEVDGEVERSGVKNLEEEFREVGEWPEGCGPEDENGGYVGDEEEEGEEKKSEAIEDGWAVVMPKH